MGAKSKSQISRMRVRVNGVLLNIPDGLTTGKIDEIPQIMANFHGIIEQAK